MKMRIFKGSLYSSYAAAVLPVLVFLAVVGLGRVGLFDLAELQGYDLLVFTGGIPPPYENLAIVDFDNATVQAIGEYPIPREYVARVLSRIAEGQPAVIGLDKLLSETKGQGADQQLAAVLGDAGEVVLPDVFGTSQIPASEPLPIFRDMDRPMGFVNLVEDPDGFVRRMILFMKTKEYSGLSFPVEIASNYLGEPLTREGPVVYRLGKVAIPLDGTGHNTALLGAWNPRPALSIVPAERLLSGNFDVREFRGKIVLVGESSEAGKDLYATPLFRLRKLSTGRDRLSGLELHAVALNSLLTGRIIRVMKPPAELIMSFLFITLTCALVILLRPWHGIPATGLLFGGVFLTSHLLFSRAQLWMPFVSIEAGVALSLTAGLGYRFWQEGVFKSQAEAGKRHEAKERAKLEDEMISARQIQLRLLPASLPKLDGLEIAARYEACLHVSGDYYDFLQPDPMRLLFVIADVQGHGVSSGMIMSSLQATLRNILHGQQGQSPAAIVAALNDALMESTRGERLVTLFLSILDLSTRELVYVNAGHVPPFLLQQRGNVMQKLEEGGMLLGVFPGTDYKQASVMLQAGDVLVAKTDGITEANNAAGEEYSLERVAATVRRSVQEPAQEIVDRVFQNVAEFDCGGDHEDDKILVVIKIS
jgi:serine phosphatase RsbU (regulator of sigma subunit)/CHASE2 domain-containing sensor protein